MKRIATVTMCALALVFALGLAACGDAGGGSSSSAGGESSSSSAASSSSSASTSGSSSASTSSSSSSSTSASSSSSTSSSSDSGFDFVDECTDGYGNITLYALTELKGWQVETLLDQQGYEWNDSNSIWERGDGASFAAIKETGVYTQDTYNEMNEKGGAIAACGMNVVAGYSDPEEALKGTAKCVVEDSYFENGGGIAIFYGPSMQEYLAVISPYDEPNTVLFVVFSKEAIGSGFADELLGQQVGGSFEEVWKSITGKDSYGH